MRSTLSFTLGLFFLLAIGACSSPSGTDTVDDVQIDSRVFEPLLGAGIPAELHLPETDDTNIALATRMQPGTGQTIVQLSDELNFWLRKETTALDAFRTELNDSPIFKIEYLPSNKNTIFCKAKLPDGTTVAHHIISQLDLNGEKWIARTDPSAEFTGAEADWLLEVVQSIRPIAN